MNADHDRLRLLLGGYLLGGLDAADHDRVDAHLITCEPCRDELARLGPVPELLQRLPAADRAAASATEPERRAATPSPERVAGLLRRMRAERAPRARRAAVVWLAAAAALLLVVVGTGLALLLPDRHAGPPSSRGGGGTSSAPLVTARFVAAGGGALAGTATLTAKAWGVSVALEVTSLTGEGPFVLRVLGGAGQVEQAATWGRTASGAARVTGASSLQLATVRSVAVADRHGAVLATAHV